ncbi:predicted protein [Plenodomus lingam JN3]|uniref:Predicted protein n=1 Tax=Leptosphaeria maculans (strain JN3 / isolate v23.1.3 / race Av1-4-5-6-7-8) TaxID=985895 RepID=E4ZYS8_LEPMJ|nr:predicted protein [Plenodomus lingam JN3]CBX96604.1 predicted protein [Plenodomus lingam JN3]
MCERERLNEVPRVYRELFQRTREFADGVGKLVGALGRGGCCEDGHGSFDVINTGKIPPTTTKISTWAEAACLLVQWSRGILRHPSLGFEKLLLSQRESIHWILDDALLRICLDHWDTVTPSHLPWDLATAPLQDCLMQACKLIPEWAARDADEYRKWDVRVVYSVREALEQSYFGRSRRFLAQSRRLHELWRTVGLWGGGRLPVELAEVIVGIVCAAEGLPEGNLRKVFLPAKENKVERNGNGNGNAFGYLRATANTFLATNQHPHRLKHTIRQSPLGNPLHVLALLDPNFPQRTRKLQILDKPVHRARKRRLLPLQDLVPYAQRALLGLLLGLGFRVRVAKDGGEQDARGDAVHDTTHTAELMTDGVGGTHGNLPHQETHHGVAAAVLAVADAADQILVLALSLAVLVVLEALEQNRKRIFHMDKDILAARFIHHGLDTVIHRTHSRRQPQHPRRRRRHLWIQQDEVRRRLDTRKMLLLMRLRIHSRRIIIPLARRQTRRHHNQLHRRLCQPTRQPRLRLHKPFHRIQRKLPRREIRLHQPRHLARIRITAAPDANQTIRLLVVEQPRNLEDVVVGRVCANTGFDGYNEHAQFLL